MTGIDDDGGLHVRGRAGDRSLPPAYVGQHVELAYATTVHGTQGETVERAHLVVGETTGAAAAYVGMTRGRERNTAHLVAETVDEARAQWIAVFSRDRADLPTRDNALFRASTATAAAQLAAGSTAGSLPNRAKCSRLAGSASDQSG